MAMTDRMREPARLYTIGAVVKMLTEEFPDITVSKVRFLESEGLVDPIRTPSGYRKFSDRDVDRLRYVLRAQRDHFLPLRVIADHLDAIDRGLEPPTVTDSRPRVPTISQSAALAPSAPVSRPVLASPAEIAAETGLEPGQVTAMEESGLIRRSADGLHYGSDAVDVARTVAELLSAGLDLRHLAANRRAAEAQFERIEALVNASRSNRSARVSDAVREQAEVLASLQARLHAQLLRSRLVELTSA